MESKWTWRDLVKTRG